METRRLTNVEMFDRTGQILKLTADRIDNYILGYMSKAISNSPASEKLEPEEIKELASLCLESLKEKGVLL